MAAINPVLIATVAGKLLDLIKEKEPGLTDIPGDDLLKRAIKAVLDGQGLIPGELNEDFAPARALFFLKSLLDFKGISKVPSRANLEKLLKDCFGTPHSAQDNPLPSNRGMVIGGPKNVDFIFKVDTSVLPPQLPVDGERLGKMVQAAWMLWQEAVLPEGSISVRLANSEIGAPNLVIRCGAIDGTGNTLGETTSFRQTGATATHTIVLDLSEQWTEGKLMACLIHEIGHALGLEHVADRSAIMAASLNPDFNDKAPRDIELTDADREAIRKRLSL